MSHRPNESFVRSSRGSSTCPWYTVGRKINDRNLEQQIKNRFCVKFGKSGSETLALLTVAYGEYTMKKSSVFEWHRQFKDGLGDVQDDPRNTKDSCKCGQSTILGALRLKTKCETDSRRIGHEYENSVIDYYE
jgi:hypothetical protein